ncbi:hypothetical protein PPERSA_12964 [Pseudocohnilembus persalinus]|uniref:Uncharacterized protein n=1 Tax=Pseudocohnilembus persalinus TaxID=266149 RepID=A0A0V0R1T7_PSEPJ|nr:hypothetical protein PPERSA_12964 [Pseudocohnilembus persalinus]|eukprot:KRX08483.1 hypothetical protein PPERSA_12964 [Pseudocohnilembus persalinus]
MEKNKDSNKQIFSKNSDTKIQNSQKNQDNSIASQLELQDYLNYFQNEEIQCPPKKTSQQESDLEQENICQISIQKTVNQYQNNQKIKKNDSNQNKIKNLNKNEYEDEDILYTDEFIQPDFNNSYIPQELKKNSNFMQNSQFQSQIEKNENPPLSSQRKPLNQDKQGDIQQYLQNKNKNQCDLIQYSDENNDCIFVQEDQFNQNNSQVQQTNVNQFQNSMKRSKNSEFSTTNSNNNMKKNKRIQSEQLGILNLNTNISPKNLNKNSQNENSEKNHQKSSKSVCSAEQFKQQGKRFE